MILSDVRAAVRTQADLDAEDLPDATVDTFIREGFDRTFATEQRWPFFQYAWALNQVDVEDFITLPTSPEVDVISRLRDSDGRSLLMLDQSFAEDRFENVPEGEPRFFSVWGGQLSLWPRPSDVARTYTLRGWRKPTWTGVGTEELDGDERLHQAIVHYAVALAYAQIEDPEQESTYKRRWEELVSTYRRDLTRPNYHDPIVLSGGLEGDTRRPHNYINFVI